MEFHLQGACDAGSLCLVTPHQGDAEDTQPGSARRLRYAVFKRKKVEGGTHGVTGSEMIIFINNEPMLAFQVS